MRPYVTIVKDAFHEALVSRTMWVLLGIATVFLIGVAPISIEERGANLFERGDIRDEIGLIREINRQAAADKPSPGKQVAAIDAAGKATREETPEATEPPKAPAEGGQAEGEKPEVATKAFPRSGNAWLALNAAVVSRKLYDTEAWQDIKLSDEAQELVEEGVDLLDEEELGRLNRLLLEAAFSRFLNVAQKQTFFGYAVWDFGQMPVNKSFFLATALTLFADYLLGVIGIFVAVLVTSSFVPRTFETGAIDLLLSKPVSRSLVFLAKFFGGCAFITVIASYVIVGLYLIAGLRLDYWNHRFLWCIPLLLFLFAIYYSVSAMAGVLWRNAILSVVMAVMFWFVCWVLGTTMGLFDVMAMSSRKIDRLVGADDQWFASFRRSPTNPQGDFRRWDSATNTWEPTFVRDARGDAAAAAWENRFDALPVYDAKLKRLLAIGNLFQKQSGDFTGPWLFAASAQGGWRQEILGKLSTPVRQLLVRSDGKLLGLASEGILEIPASGQTLSDAQMKDENAAKSLESNLLDVEAWALPSAAVASATTTDVVVYDPGRLRLLRLADGKRYEVQASFDVSRAAPCNADALAFVGDRVVLGLRDGRVFVFAVKEKSLDLLAEHAPKEKTSIQQVRITPDVKSFVVRSDDEQVRWYEIDAVSNSSSMPPATAVRSDITALAMSPDGSFAAAYAFNHVLMLDAEGDVTSRITPTYDRFEAIYWYLVRPLYLVFPKPGQLGNLTAYFLYGKETIEVAGDSEVQQQKLDIYTPIWSNLLFLSVMLAIGCWYVSRRDF